MEWREYTLYKLYPSLFGKKIKKEMKRGKKMPEISVAGPVRGATAKLKRGQCKF